MALPDLVTSSGELPSNGDAHAGKPKTRYRRGLPGGDDNRQRRYPAAMTTGLESGCRIHALCSLRVGLRKKKGRPLINKEEDDRRRVRAPYVDPVRLEVQALNVVTAQGRVLKKIAEPQSFRIVRAAAASPSPGRRKGRIGANLSTRKRRRSFVFR
ncbi:unnamed protein product [Calypogeia fissa]